TTARRECIVSIYLGILKLGTENRLSVNCDGPAERVSDRHDGSAGRTVTVHLVKNGILGCCDDLSDGPSQARRAVTGCANPRQNRISLHVLRDVLDYSFLNYKD
ncbi:hypothetical protein EJD97_009780, partial [Solanum chilense]